jgi:hypothetical protein
MAKEWRRRMAKRTYAAVTPQKGASEERFHVGKYQLVGDDEDVDIISPRLNYPIEDSGDVYLARLILAQTALDAQSKHDDYVRQCARAYLTNVHEDLTFICEMGRVNVGYLVRTWRRLLGGVTEFPRGYEELYKKEKKWKRPKAAGSLRSSSAVMQASS